MHLHSVRVDQQQWEHELDVIPTADLADTRQFRALPDDLVPRQLPVHETFEQLVVKPPRIKVVRQVNWRAMFFIGVACYAAGMIQFALQSRFL